jgi:hypothetical protein
MLVFKIMEWPGWMDDIAQRKTHTRAQAIQTRIIMEDFSKYFNWEKRRGRILREEERGGGDVWGFEGGVVDRYCVYMEILEEKRHTHTKKKPKKNKEKTHSITRDQIPTKNPFFFLLIPLPTPSCPSLLNPLPFPLDAGSLFHPPTACYFLPHT